jgi:hypothetical protein
VSRQSLGCLRFCWSGVREQKSSGSGAGLPATIDVESDMRNLLTLICVLCVLLVAGVAQSDGLVISMRVSPDVIVIASDGTYITVHARIPFDQVDISTVALNGVPLAHQKADDLGYFVGKFASAPVKETVEPRWGTLVLTGYTVEGVYFTGEDTVRVR